MNWYRISTKLPKIRIVGYNQDFNELSVNFVSSDKVYEYHNVSPFLYEKIRALLFRGNFSKVAQILRDLARIARNERNVV